MDSQLADYLARRETTVRRVQELIVERLHLGCAPDEIDPDSPLLGGGLDLDSMDALELVVGLEIVFKIAITDDAASRRALRSVNAIADLVMAAPAQAGR